ncbi:MAG: RdgB/HAM1 family non-canonical purine NTP pyrophosphatase [Ruminococcus sp.]|nr:RdgB/HAM1 family non-canonical purine NTP pyrophosphatase [Ruminococcus sp.]
MTDFLIATNNAHKVEEFKRILLPLGINVISAKDAGIDLGDVVEDGKTFAENAKIKALSAFRKSGLPSIADDSGLCVDALSGAPGIYSARFGGEDIPQSHRNELLLSEMQKSNISSRAARFVSSICCVFAEDDIIAVEGVCEGTIAHSPCGDGGFGYDPLFIYEDGRCFGTISGDEKDKVSHRGRSLRALRDKLISRKDVL